MPVIKPAIGDVVKYIGKNSLLGTVDTATPAIVIRTRTQGAYGLGPENENRTIRMRDGYGIMMLPSMFVDLLPDDWTVDLKVFGLFEEYNVYTVPHDFGADGHTWNWK